jgi:hypothetical protein
MPRQRRTTTYYVLITKELYREVRVEASSAREAMAKVQATIDANEPDNLNADWYQEKAEIESVTQLPRS